MKQTMQNELIVIQFRYMTPEDELRSCSKEFYREAARLRVRQCCLYVDLVAKHRMAQLPSPFEA